MHTRRLVTGITGLGVGAALFLAAPVEAGKPPAATISIADSSASEWNTAARVQLTRTVAKKTVSVTVDLSSSEATVGTDYDDTSVVATFQGKSPTADVYFRIYQDGVSEPPETIVARLSNLPRGYTDPGGDTGNVVIVDDEHGAITVPAGHTLDINNLVLDSCHVLTARIAGDLAGLVLEPVLGTNDGTECAGPIGLDPLTYVNDTANPVTFTIELTDETCSDAETIDASFSSAGTSATTPSVNHASVRDLFAAIGAPYFEIGILDCGGADAFYDEDWFPTDSVVSSLTASVTVRDFRV